MTVLPIKVLIILFIFILLFSGFRHYWLLLQSVLYTGFMPVLENLESPGI